ncbi:hypothetical protein ACDA63_04395 [Uliginosibacterium sp. sgz301328]|uniref:hemerythrin domain-containing protein n=1 Tax=Uliginosibacterium sp. sgz301328 TaxID=3243764 RepID=UPI00359CC4B3
MMGKDSRAVARFDMYALVHKGLRAFMSDTVSLVGRTDWSDERDALAATAQLRKLMETCFKHLQHENEFIHAAMEARRPGSSGDTALDHAEHIMAVKAFLADTQELELLPVPLRQPLASEVYKRLAVFVGENFEHMAHEEAHNNGVLWAAYSDAELIDIHDRLVASIPPQEMGIVMRWMLPYANAQERAMLLGDIRSKAPAEAFDAMLDMLRPLVSRGDWSKLMKALGIPATTMNAVPA